MIIQLSLCQWGFFNEYMQINYHTRPCGTFSNTDQNARMCLFENSRIVNDDSEACDIFHSHFASVCNDVGGNDCIQIDEYIDAINKNFSSYDIITKNQGVMSIKNCSHERKPSGYCSLPPKLLQLGKHALTPPITTLANMSIQQCLFPNRLKNVELYPVFKKDDSMIKTNFKPLGFLVCFSKIFESLLK